MRIPQKQILVKIEISGFVKVLRLPCVFCFMGAGSKNLSSLTFSIIFYPILERAGNCNKL
jgi:hypothetical protein